MGDEVTTKPYSWGAWVGGFLTSLITGFILNFVLGFFALWSRNAVLAILIELIPGVLFALMSFRRWRDPFPQGFLVGAAVVALVGGICGTMLGSGMR